MDHEGSAPDTHKHEKRKTHVENPYSDFTRVVVGAELKSFVVHLVKLSKESEFFRRRILEV